MQMEEQEANEPQNHDLICAICLDIFFRPTTVYPCRHIFCDPCLRRLSNARIVRCPICRTPIKRCLFNRGKYGQPLWLLQLTFTTYANLISKRQPLYEVKRVILKYLLLYLTGAAPGLSEDGCQVQIFLSFFTPFQKKIMNVFGYYSKVGNSLHNLNFLRSAVCTHKLSNATFQCKCATITLKS